MWVPFVRRFTVNHWPSINTVTVKLTELVQLILDGIIRIRAESIGQKPSDR